MVVTARSYRSAQPGDVFQGIGDRDVTGFVLFRGDYFDSLAFRDGLLETCPEIADRVGRVFVDHYAWAEYLVYVIVEESGSDG